ncbi:MAG: carboxypeptidase-like regulatory domain-containing protein [Parafilimonas sp.]
MAEPSTHIIYSLEDIQRYLQGEMPAAEMHAIEKAALQDPFLADAIEGFSEVDFTTANQHLNEINASLFAEKQKSKVVAFNNRTRWLNIAAMIIIIAGLGIVSVYLLKNSGKQQQVAQIKNQPVENKVFKDSSSKNMNTLSASQDTTMIIAQNKQERKPSTKKLSASSKTQNKTEVTSAEKAASLAEADIESVAASPTIAQENKSMSKTFAPVSSNKKNDLLPNILLGKISGLSTTSNTLSGKVIDENNKPIAGAYVQSSDKKETAVTDMNGNFSIQKTDTVMNVTASIIGYDSKNVNIESGDSNLIRLKDASSNLNEVVVVGYGRSKKIKPVADSAMPVGGWQNFNNYVFTQLNKDTTNTAANYEDLVEMEFLIDNNGNPYNIKITKPLDDQRNEKAVQILKSGPKWTHTSKKKKVKVSISF